MKDSSASGPAQRGRPTKSNPAEMVRNLVRAEIDRCDERSDDRIDAKKVAQNVARKLDPAHKAPPETTYCAVEGIAQVARSLLSGRHGLPGIDDTDTQVDAFSRELNDRYGVLDAEGNHVYALRASMTRSERDQVHQMLERRRDGYAQHMKLFDAWDAETPLP